MLTTSAGLILTIDFITPMNDWRYFVGENIFIPFLVDLKYFLNHGVSACI
jgi:hypothetical protein